MSKVTFNNKSNPFFRSLKEKVDLHFAEKKTDLTGNFGLYFKSILQVTSAICLYIALVFFQPATYISIILCVLLGCNLSVIGFNIMHEGGHQSFSKIKWVNRLTAYSLNVMGGSSLFWKTKHNLNHHTYTNIDGMDSDIELAPYMRLHAAQPRYWMHRFQHIYWFVLYGFSYVSWIFVDDFTKYFTGTIASGSENLKWKTREHIIFWSTKLAYTIVYIGLPAYFVGFWPALAGFGIMVFACGLSLGIVFQMAHIVEDTAFPSPHSETNKIEEEWGIHQVQTTANFATNSRVMSWLLGGLNFQVEHHLFPKISHVHYPAINKLVKETCIEFNVTYLEYPSLFKAFCSHLVHIRKLGVA